ncbi:hypothetical protein RJT34_09916 [Clitoria ternatea]|uniref:Uncharacterized protein n=1 Tax=Clitoria ternatea TaxID=43366 RepID=A0AAN9PVP5_CLITE
MATLITKPSNPKDKDIIVGRFNPNGYCKKHPKHRQSPGVCSLCLRDKLSQLPSSSSNSSTKTNTLSCDSSSVSSNSLSSYCSSSANSSCASPNSHPFPSTSFVSIFLLNNNAKHGGLVKSRSVAVFPRRRKEGDEGDVDGHVKKSVKKHGFWFKLLHPKRKKMEDKATRLVHTRSLLETMT